MIIPVVGFDPSFLHWGIAQAELDLATGVLNTPHLTVVEPERITTKQVRKNSKDLHEAKQLAEVVFEVIKGAKAIFVECPVGSQNARACVSYGVCVGILGSMLAQGVELIEVEALEVKKALTGNKNASKPQMVATALELYPDANFPRHTRNGKTFKKGDLMSSAEHVADAIGTIHAGVNTPIFRQLLKLYS